MNLLISARLDVPELEAHVVRPAHHELPVLVQRSGFRVSVVGFDIEGLDFRFWFDI